MQYILFLNYIFLVDRPDPDCKVGMCPALTHSAPQLQIDPKTNIISMPCCKGYCSSKATHGVEAGSWYFEVQVIKGSVRVGWGQALAEIQAPIGYDEYSYGISNKQKKIFHCSRGYPVNFDEDVRVIGCLLSIPENFDLLPEDCDLLRELEQKYPPLNFLTTYNVKQNHLKNGSIRFFADGHEISSALFENIYRAKYFPSISIFGDASVQVLFKESEFTFRIPEGARAFEHARNN